MLLNLNNLYKAILILQSMTYHFCYQVDLKNLLIDRERKKIAIASADKLINTKRQRHFTSPRPTTMSDRFHCAIIKQIAPECHRMTNGKGAKIRSSTLHFTLIPPNTPFFSKSATKRKPSQKT